jgi:hypothetical protein
MNQFDSVSITSLASETICVICFTKNLFFKFIAWYSIPPPWFWIWMNMNAQEKWGIWACLSLMSRVAALTHKLGWEEDICLTREKMPLSVTMVSGDQLHKGWTLTKLDQPSILRPYLGIHHYLSIQRGCNKAQMLGHYSNIFEYIRIRIRIFIWIWLNFGSWYTDIRTVTLTSSPIILTSADQVREEYSVETKSFDL